MSDETAVNAAQHRVTPAIPADDFYGQAGVVLSEDEYPHLFRSPLWPIAVYFPEAAEGLIEMGLEGFDTHVGWYAAGELEEITW